MWQYDSYDYDRYVDSLDGCSSLSPSTVKELASWAEHAIEHFPETTEENEEVWGAIKHICDIVGVYCPARKVK